MKLRPPFEPVRVAALELSDPIAPAIGGTTEAGVRYGSQSILVRLHGSPLGIVRLDLAGGDVDAATVAASIWTELGPAIRSHLEADGSDAPGHLPIEGLGTDPAPCRDRFAPAPVAATVSVVVPTCRRPDMVTATVDAVLAGDTVDVEVIVVDNAPDDARTRAVVAARYGADARVRYVQEWRRGVSWARNTGVAEARGETVLFVDDDVVVDRSWVGVMTATLANNPSVACVTGLTLASELDTEAQVWFEHYGGFSRPFVPASYDLQMRDAPTLLYPYTPPVAASGNMAIRASVFRQLAGFDVRLGPGTPTKGGEDLDLFVRLLRAGHTVAYEPEALVWHRHRRDDAALRRQTFGYGTGAIANLTKWSLRERDLRSRIVRSAAQLPAAFGPRPDAGGDHRSPPASLLVAQLAGAACGPFLWLRSAATNRERFAWR